MLLFTSFQILKASGPGTIFEGSDAVYNVKLNGPPPTRVGFDAEGFDSLTRSDIKLQSITSLYVVELFYQSTSEMRPPPLISAL